MTDARQRLLVAERHVREAEARIARQREIIVEMDRDKHPQAAKVGRELLNTLLQSLDVAKQHVERLKREIAATKR